MKFLYAILIVGMIARIGLTAFSQQDFANCYNGCSRQYASGVKAQTASYTPPSGGAAKAKGDFLTAVYNYEACIRGYKLEKLDDLYNAGVSHSGSGLSSSFDDNVKQDGYCNFFWELFEPKYASQQDLLTSVQTCFAAANGAANGCTFVNPAGTQAGNDGSSHYALFFTDCIDNCIDLTKQEDQGVYDTCVNVAQEDYNVQAAASPPSADQTAAYVEYEQCIKYSQECGRLSFYDFDNFQYKTYYEACYNPCIEAYKSNANKHTPRETYFSAIQACVIPDASSYQRIDNTVQSDGSLMKFAMLGFVALVLLLA